jgi:cyclohexanone monooxygenase
MMRLPSDPAFSPDELRAKYRTERDKRLRPEGNDQYVRMAERYARFAQDPYAPVRPRAPLHDHVDVLIVGGGFSGLLAAARLKEAGIRDIRIVERGGDFGGTWYWNRYPGAQCDVESYIYLPLLEELGYMPRERYSNAPEIFAHSRAIGAHYGLYEKACFHTLVTELRWQEDSLHWVVSTDRGDRMTARFICLADGPLSQPKLPGIEGIDSFQGKIFHASRWDYDYTGGAVGGKLDKLGDKRVGIVGTGATAIQCIPGLAESARQLYVFQRTPSSVLARDNRATDREWAATLGPGWQQARMTNFNRVTSGNPQAEDQVGDGLSIVLRQLSTLPGHHSEQPLSAEELEKHSEQVDFELMEQVRARVDHIVRDPQTAAALKPWYRLFCKRPCFNDEYLQAFNRPNVTLVDTDGRGVTRLTGTAVIVGEQAFELDCLILATGFEVGTEYPRRSGFEIFGREELTLSEKWKGGMRTLHGLQTHGFPNCFFLGMIQGGYTANYTHMLCEQGAHVAYLVDQVNKRGMQAVEATLAGEDEWVGVITSYPVGNLKFYRECTPGYYNNEGKLGHEKSARIPSFYWGGPEAFFRILHDWRSQGDAAGAHFIAGVEAGQRK